MCVFTALRASGFVHGLASGIFFRLGTRVSCLPVAIALTKSSLKADVMDVNDPVRSDSRECFL